MDRNSSATPSSSSSWRILKLTTAFVSPIDSAAAVNCPHPLPPQTSPFAGDSASLTFIIVKIVLTVYRELLRLSARTSRYDTPPHRRIHHDVSQQSAVVYLLGFFLDLINMFIASVAFPAMAQTYHATPSALAWVSNGYIAGLTLVIPFSALTRRIGAKHVILLSLVLFSVASTAAGLSATLETLIARRVLQGVGGGLLIPVGQALTGNSLKRMNAP